jgi:cytochrome b6-f complex iron-sulfur subunit
MENKIKRNEFLKSLGFKGASLLAVYCGASTLSSCKNDSGLSPSGPIDFTIDLSNVSYSKLNTVGSYLVYNQVVIARTSSAATGFAAVTQVCSHEGQSQIYYTGSGFACPVHGAAFSISGARANNVSSKGITAYQTALSGTSLRVFS